MENGDHFGLWSGLMLMPHIRYTTIKRPMRWPFVLGNELVTILFLIQRVGTAPYAGRNYRITNNKCCLIWFKWMSTLPDIDLDLFDCYTVWQCCLGAYQISERSDHFSTKSHEFETHRNLVVRRLMAFEIEALSKLGLSMPSLYYFAVTVCDIHIWWIANQSKHRMICNLIDR